MGWLGDAIGIALSSDSFWKAVALVLLGYFGWQMHEGLKKIRLELSQTSEALIKNGKPISVAGELSALMNIIRQFMTLLQEVRDEPWRLCERFVDCPAVQRKNEHVDRTETIMKENYDKAERDRAEIKAQVKMVLEAVIGNRDVLTAFVEHFAKEMLIMLKEKEEVRKR